MAARPTTATWSMSPIMSALPTVESSHHHRFVHPSIRHWVASPPPSRLRISLPEPETLRSFVDLAPLNPLLYEVGLPVEPCFPTVHRGGSLRIVSMRQGRRVPKLSRPANQRRALLRGFTTVACTVRSCLQRAKWAAVWPSMPQHRLQPKMISKTTTTSWETTTSVKTAVATVDSSDPALKGKATTKFYFVVANAKFMLDEEEHFQELLFERLRYYGEREKEQDFWLVIEPKFLDKFPTISRRLKRPAVALVSTNATWITFMKLRLDRVLSESYEAESLEEALASNPVSLEFEKPDNWVAPYPKYEFGWWEPFLPVSDQKPKA